MTATVMLAIQTSWKVAASEPAPMVSSMVATYMVVARSRGWSCVA